MCSRVLGHLVLEAPTERGRDWVCKRILSCPDEHALVLLAHKYIFTFIGACASTNSLSLFIHFLKSRRPQDNRSQAVEAHRPSQRLVVLVVVLPRAEKEAPIRITVSGEENSRAFPYTHSQLKLWIFLTPSLFSGVGARRIEMLNYWHIRRRLGFRCSARCDTHHPSLNRLFDIRTLSWYAGLPSNGPLCELTLRFYRLENVLTLDGDASDAFRNVWLEETVRSIPRLILGTTFSLNFRLWSRSHRHLCHLSRPHTRRTLLTSKLRPLRRTLRQPRRRTLHRPQRRTLSLSMARTLSRWRILCHHPR
jgi:hypothetical protein